MRLYDFLVKLRGVYRRHGNCAVWGDLDMELTNPDIQLVFGKPPSVFDAPELVAVRLGPLPEDHALKHEQEDTDDYLEWAKRQDEFEDLQVEELDLHDPLS